jgi:hypothetical protein
VWNVDEPPFPSPADAGRLAFYPFAYLCLFLRLRARTFVGDALHVEADAAIDQPAAAGRGALRLARERRLLRPRGRPVLAS